MNRCLLSLLCLLLPAGLVEAGSCSYRSYSAYSSYGYSPGYGHGASYGSNKGYYWPGGWYGGDKFYAQGFYQAGYYNYPSSYANHYNYYEDPVFIKYKAVIPLVELPSYGAYHCPNPPAGAVSAPPAPVPGAMPSASTGVSIDAKLDRLLSLSQETSGRVVRLEARIAAVEAKTGTTPPPEAARLPGTTPAEGDDVPNLFFAKCASCHEEKVAATKGKKLVLFLTGPMGVEMAQRDGKGEIVPLAPETLKKIEHELTEGTMPPPKGPDGKAAELRLTAEERRKMIDFAKRALVAAPK